ncbi:MAG TPA: hypothetical protein PL129_12640, partial [bacterium]|nr:hypothetical protein [bacterium]
MGFNISAVWAQNEDNLWLFGYDSNEYPEHPGIDRFVFDFSDSLTISSFSSETMWLLDTYSSICDSEGNLLLLSNGCYIEKANSEYLSNSYGLNPGLLGLDQCYDDSSGYNVPQSMIMLPDPGNPTQFHLFHYPLIISDGNFILRNLLHTVVDLSANSGEGTTLVKNQIVVDDTLDADGLHAVRHANGRDWWVICAKRRAPTFHFLLLTPDTILTHAQTIGDSNTVTTYGEIVFSPDGSNLARFDAKDDLFLFDFDRCTGMLSNPLHIPITDDSDNENYAGLAFS